MGGHKAGEVAAELPSKRSSASWPSDDGGGCGWPYGIEPTLSYAGNRLRTAIHLANVRVFRPPSPPTTTPAWARPSWRPSSPDRLSVGHVGDSRLYLLAGDQIRQLTHDDSWMASMLAEDPAADVVELERHPMRNALTNVVGVSQRTDVHVVEEVLHGGERLLLSTDGVHGELDHERIERLTLDSDDLKEAAAGLVAAALARGSRDNCTAVVAQYEPD